MKFLQQIILLIAVISAVSGRTLSNKTDTATNFQSDDVTVSKDLLRKSPKKFVPSILKNAEEGPKKPVSKAIVEPVVPAVEEEPVVPSVEEDPAVEVTSEVTSAYLRPIFREDLPFGVFRSSASGLSDRGRIEFFRNIEEDPVNTEETKDIFLIDEDSTNLHNLEGELGPLGQSKHEESLFGGFRPLEWE